MTGYRFTTDLGCEVSLFFVPEHLSPDECGPGAFLALRVPDKTIAEEPWRERYAEVFLSPDDLLYLKARVDAALNALENNR